MIITRSLLCIFAALFALLIAPCAAAQSITQQTNTMIQMNTMMAASSETVSFGPESWNYPITEKELNAFLQYSYVDPCTRDTLRKRFDEGKPVSKNLTIAIAQSCEARHYYHLALKRLD